jgi:hypothetical protein
MGLEQRSGRGKSGGTFCFETMKTLFSIVCILAATVIPSRAQEWRVVPVSSLQKLTAKTRGHLEPFIPVPAQLQAARGEWECFQIVVTAGEKPLHDLRLKPTPLATHLGEFIFAKNIQIYRENFVFVGKPSGNARMEKMWWPDALIPLDLQKEISVAPRASEVFWVAIQAPPNAAPGLYFGAMDVTAANEKPRSLFVSMDVKNIQMPAPTMHATVAVYYDVMRDWYAKNLNAPFDEKLKKQYYDFLLDYRINAYDLPVDWSTPEAAKYLRDPRVLSVRLPPLAEKEKLQTALGVLRANNALHKNFYYWIDEPAPQEYSRVRETTRELHALDPKIKQCVTVHPNQSLQGAVDIWCPNIGDFFGLGHLDETMLAAERKKGNETWWYTMVEPKYPYPTWLLDDDAMSVRSYGALMARYGITGFVYSMAHGWGPKPLENLESFAGTNGDGTLLYPSEIVGGVGPMPSIRLMLLRDAIEDYELMHTLPDETLSKWLTTLLAPQPLFGTNASEFTRFRHAMLKTLGGTKTEYKTRFAYCGWRPSFNIPHLQEKPVIDGKIEETFWKPQTHFYDEFQFNNYQRNADTQLWHAHDKQNLFIAFRISTNSFDKDWCAVEIAPMDGSKRFRFVVTSKGNGVVEKHTREGRLQIEELDWKFAALQNKDNYVVEMQISLSLVEHDGEIRLNALRRNGSTLRITRAFNDAGDVTLMPVAFLQ